MDFSKFRNRYEHKEVKENLDQVTSNPFVSVCVQTYQHVSYIRECLDGILMQETDYSFEILLGDDHSTDGTREICLKYAERYPNRIRLFLHHRKNNIPINGRPTGRFNFLFNLYNANGKYIAICEGDDFWTDSKKLQKQVNFLESHREFSLACGGYTKRYAESGVMEEVIVNDPKWFPDNTFYGFEFDLGDTLKAWLAKTMTTLFRRNSFDMKVLMKYQLLRDVHLFYHIIKNGKGFYFQQVFGIFNVHKGGIHSMVSKTISINLAYNIYNELFQFNKDSYSRKKAFKATVEKLNFDLQNKYINNDRNGKLTLLFQAYSFVRSPIEGLKIIRLIGVYLLTIGKALFKK